MILHAALLCAAVLVAGDEAPPAAQLSVIAVRATKEGRSEPHFDGSLATVRRALGNLPYDSYYQLKSGTLKAAFDKETLWPITEDYTLSLLPVSRETGGRVRIRTRVIAKRHGTSVNALDTTIVLAPGRPVNLGGMHLKNGELVVVLTLKS